MKQRKKFLAFNHLRRSVALLALAILIPPTMVWAQQWSGDGSGTSDNPYQIKNYAQLKEFAAIVNAGTTGAYAILMNDIVCKKDPEDLVYDTGWTPIGNSSNKYTGTFDGLDPDDGQVHTITGLSTATEYSSNYVGLFGCVGSDGVVKNVTLEEANINGQAYIAGIVGRNYGTVQNVVVKNSNIRGSNSNVGGVVGSSGGGIIENAVVSNTQITGQYEVGGIVGYNAKSPLKSSCLIGSSSVSGGNSPNNAFTHGGIAGTNENTIQNCYVAISGYISATADNGGEIGGIAGINSGTIQNCHYSGSGAISGTTSSTTEKIKVGGISGKNIGTVQYCYYAGTGEITATASSSNIGAIIGENLNKSTVQNCYYIYYTTSMPAFGSNDGTATNVTGLTTDQFKDEDFLTTYSFSSDNWLQGVFAPLLKGMPYTIIFKANDDTDYAYDKTVTSEDVDVLSDYAFTRSGYHFTGWNTKADGTGIDIPVDTKAGYVGPETLYAQWCANTNLTGHAATEATCTEAGNVEGYECTVCHKYFSDSKGTTEITENSWVIPATGHTLTAHAAVAANCTEPGNTAYWSCSACGKYFSDAAGTDEIAADSWVIPAHHTLTAHAAVAATCTDSGNSAYWECSVCHKYFSDAAGITEIEEDSWVTPALGHDLVEQAEVAATCTAAGRTAYQKCSRCDYKTDYEEIPALGHDIVNHEAVAPTCTTAGHTAYEGCSRCDYKSDDYEVIPASPATGHNFENGVCTICGHNYAQGTCGADDPKTTTEDESKNVTWLYDNDTHTLTISGTGAMMYYGLTSDNLHSTAPWNHLDGELEHVIVTNGVTSVGAYAFAMCRKLVNASLPTSVFEIDQAAFYTTDLIRIDIPSATAVTLAKNAFSSCHDDLVIAVPSTLLGTYQTATNWSAFAAKLVGVLSETTGFGTTFATGNYEYTRTFKCGVASTVCLPFSLDATQAASVGNFYTFAGIDKTGEKWEVIMQEATNKVSTDLTANTPYLFMPFIFEGKDKGDDVQLTFSGTVSTARDAGYSGWMESGTSNEWIFQGVYYNYTWAEGNENLDKVYGFAAQSYNGDSYTVSPGDFVMAGAGASIAPFRAFLQCNSGGQSNGTKRRNAPAETGSLPARMAVRLVGADGIVTGISSLTSDPSPAGEGSWFTLDGRKLNSTPNARGLYINNGKKVIKK